MNFHHSHFDIEIDTGKMLEIFTSMTREYSKCPNTVCLFCPGCETVEAHCCKSFSPSMMLCEFINIMRQIEKWSVEDRADLILSCVESYLNPSLVQPCVLLGEDNRCRIYEARPTACRFYGQYSNQSWNGRIDNLAKRLGIVKGKLPMKGEQCKNIKVENGNESIAFKEEEAIFKKIYDIDVKMFENERDGKDIVYNALTYMPFDAHYLLITVGPDILETLTDFRLELQSSRRKFDDGDLEKLELDNLEKNVKDFVDVLREMVCQQDKEANDATDNAAS